ncbi:MAG: aldose 1-epimerase family protein [Clostridia bacterium]|nr:aldose 1-epimerase family protein [Clostridia bacterium]
MVTISNDVLSVVISEKGAELQSVKGKDGHEYIWQADPAYWAQHAPIMFPICGGLKEDAYYLDGKRYPMTKHGFAKLCDWQVEEAGKDRAVFALCHKQEGFPFDYIFKAAYQLDGNHLVITYTVENKGDTTFWYGIGSHEAYTTPGGLEACTVVFDETEKLANYELDGNLIKPEPVIMAEQTNELPLKTEYFAVDALVFPHLKSRGVTLVNSKDTHKVRVEYPDVSVLMLWTKPRADYICIEPWSNAPDYTDTDMQIEHKPGCICLKAGESNTVTHTISFM